MNKLQSLFEGWSIDSIAKFTILSIKGCKHSIVAVDCFSKQVEIYPIQNKAVMTTMNYLQHEYFPHFGKPHWLHFDARSKLLGEFADLCDMLWIMIQTTSAGYARSNGLVYRINRESKEAVGKYAL